LCCLSEPPQYQPHDGGDGGDDGGLACFAGSAKKPVARQANHHSVTHYLMSVKLLIELLLPLLELLWV
jgi:hypothetical protein